MKNITKLFVYTEYATLYTGCSWELLETKEGNSVLSKALEPPGLSPISRGYKNSPRFLLCAP
ncbi:hypothetical protein PSE_0656 [Pseudovibrio sp. FO-BEG1]|nr:hypothetical protein PSE_0656 [Pseudovibrio sp. FO-BEG1]